MGNDYIAAIEAVMKSKNIILVKHDKKFEKEDVEIEEER